MIAIHPPPDICILIPTYKEEIPVLRQTILSAALSEYPSRRIAVLIDDPPNGSAEETRALLATRQLVSDLHATFQAAGTYFRNELSQFLTRLHSGKESDVSSECHRLADLYEHMANWIEGLLTRDENANSVFGHTNTFFREQIILAPIARYRARANELRKADIEFPQLERGYRRLAALLSLEITSFERKQFTNLSHAPNKAMNLNSYIGLIGTCFRVADDSELIRIEECDCTAATIVVPHADFLLTLDADSLILPDYVLKLTRLMDQQPKTAVVQTPYSAIPGSANAIERAAGAQTDVQYIVHQGFTQFRATYWVGANALLRLTALRDVEQDATERGHRVPVFIQDRTVIEDTGSTIDLVRKGWTLFNHPERLAYSATPADFGSLIIQRRRWANGGLIIFPDIVRYFLNNNNYRPRVAEIAMRAYYLCSPAFTSFALILLMLPLFGNAVATIWLPCIALPYLALYARDLRFLGYNWVDLPRVYALNLMLLPINLAGVIRSIEQMLSGRKAAFGRTPKVEQRTAVPLIHIFWQVALPGMLATASFFALTHGRHYYLATFLAVNAGFTLYGFNAFIGVRDALNDSLLATAGLVRQFRAWAGGTIMSGADANARAGDAVGKSRIAAMEGLRAYAVILVFFVHFMSLYFDRYRGINLDSYGIDKANSIADLLGYYLWASHYGVDIFFLLSGFLIFKMVTRPDFRYLTFLSKRLLRLYPAFLFAICLQLLYSMFFWREKFDPSTIAENLFFLNGITELKVKPILVPTWSLAYEWIFYIAFPLLAFWFARSRKVTFVHIIAIALIFMLILTPIGAHYLRFVMFFVGATLACMPPKPFERWIQRIPDGPVIAAMVLVNMIFAFDQNLYFFIWPFAVTSFLMVARVIYGQGILNRIFCLRPLRALGNLSYSFYLLHALAVIAVVDHLGPLLRGASGIMQFAILISVSFLVSIVSAKISFFLFEKIYFDRKKNELPMVPFAEPTTDTQSL